MKFVQHRDQWISDARVFDTCGAQVRQNFKAHSCGTSPRRIRELSATVSMFRRKKKKQKINSPVPKGMDYLLNPREQVVTKGQEEQPSPKSPTLRRKRILVHSAILNKGGFPKSFKTPFGSVYYFPRHLGLNSIQNSQLLHYLNSDTPIWITYYDLGEDRRVTKVEQFTFDSQEEYYTAKDLDSTTSTEEKAVAKPVPKTPQINFKISLAVISHSKGLLCLTEVFIASEEKLSQYFHEKTNGAAFVTVALEGKEKEKKSPSNTLPRYYVIVPLDYLSFSVPDSIQ
jgi:hypothetical protein